MSEKEFNELLEESWTRALRPEERARLRLSASADTARLEKLEEEEALDEVLAALPDAPVSSNFTSRVMAAVEQEERKKSRKKGWTFWGIRGSWLRGLAFGAAMLALSLGGYQQYLSHERSQLAASVVAFGAVDAPNVELLKDFDAIVRMSSSPKVDSRLMDALE